MDEASASAPMTLVIDDFQFCGEAELVAEFGLALEQAPPGLNVVIGTRVVPRLRAHRLFLPDAYAHLGEDELAFTVDEAAPLLRGRSGRMLSDEQIGKLVASTAGWVAGLELAAEAVRLAPDLEGGIAAFAEGVSTVGAYFA